MPQTNQLTSAIIVAAGSSRRMGFDKLFADLAGKPVLFHSMEAFEQCPDVAEIIVVTKEDRIPELLKRVKSARLKKVNHVITGGLERHLSVWEGLQAASSKSKLIAIHDGARPLTTPQLIHDCVELAAKVGAACCAALVPDTVKRASDEQEVTESVERAGLWAMQTPQVFTSALILQAYAHLMTRGESVTDEVSAVQRLGKKVALLKNDDWNFKITIPRDLQLAEQVMALRSKGSRAKKKSK